MQIMKLRENGLLMTVLIVGLGIAVVGVALTYLLRIPIENSIREDAVYDAVAATRPHIIDLVTPQDLAQPKVGADYDAMDRLLAEQHVVGPHIARLKLWNANGTLVYSTKREQVGDTHPVGGNFAKALAGAQAWELTSSTESHLDRELGEVLEVYVPLTWSEDGVPAGVLEVYLPYAHYSVLLATIRNNIFLAIAIASITLPVALYILYSSGFRRIRAERDRAVQRAREVSALNRILQGNAAHSYEISDRLKALRDELAREDLSGADLPVLAQWFRQIRVRVGELAALSVDPLRSGERAGLSLEERITPWD